MPSYNKVQLMGNLTRDPDLKYTQSGTAVVNVGIAVNRKWKSQSGEQKEEVCFVDLTAWGRTAEVMAQYLQKGSPLFVDGRLQLDQWESEGQKRSKLKVVIENMQFIGGKSDGGGGGRQGGGRDDRSEFFQEEDRGGGSPGFDDDNMPF
jgi:single-strand DNA-binding protein